MTDTTPTTGDNAGSPPLRCTLEHLGPTSLVSLVCPPDPEREGSRWSVCHERVRDDPGAMVDMEEAAE